jgi:succinate-semialdehyde dehydrogenase/glutarate-semialdehyde dehydrogenase
MREREAQFSRLATLEMGKLIRESRGETLLSADILTYYADRAEEFLRPYKIEQQDGEAMVVTEPLGVLLGIQPWNFPYYQVVRFAAPNLMAGNTVIVKHSQSVPQCAILFERLLRDAGAEPGLYTNLRLSNEQSAGVIADDRIQGVAVTGSERAGSAVAIEAGRVLKRSTMELGGSDPYIVLEDANLEKAIDWAVWSRLLNCGQGCVSAKRFVVVEPLYDRFLAGVLGRLERIRVGNPMEESTDIGPLSSQAARSLLLNQVERAVRAGAKLVTGGRAIDRDGFYFEPAILTEIRKGNPAYAEEFFGPVFLMFRVENETEALSLANDTSFGLASVIFSEDLQRANSLARQIEAGMVFINHPAWTAPELPFGGIKRSGYGHELSSLGIQEFVNKKLVRTQAATSPLP